MKKRLIFTFTTILPVLIIEYFIFNPIYKLQSVFIPYGLYPYDICQKQPMMWNFIKLIFIILNIFNLIIISNLIYSKLQKSQKFKKILESSNIFNLLFTDIFLIGKNHSNNHNHKHNYTYNHNLLIQKSSNMINQNNLQLYIGTNTQNEPIFIPESGLYQNMLITGTIGSGKTSSAMYPFTKQLIYYKNSSLDNKIGMLILDVKGNYYYQVTEFCKQFNRLDDLIVIELGGKYKYNPLNKPNLKPSILANRLKTILLLFSENNSESYWLDKAEQILEQSIKICRLYNNNYVNFNEIHKLITDSDYYYSKIQILKNDFLKNKFNDKQCYDLLTAITFFENEFLKLDQRTMSILKSEITRITNCFVSDYDVMNTFNPNKNEENFHGLSDIISQGKIVVLNLNISEYKNLSKIIAAYLKLDFQTEVLSRLAKNNVSRPVAFISDEYHEYVTSTDADFFAQSREAKCINIVATQSYTSLLKTLNNESTVKVIIQNLINKIWLRTDDCFTIEEAQKQIGKEDKEKVSRSVSENAKQTVYNYFTGSLNSRDSNITESLNSVIQHDFIYDTNFFTQNLDTFNCLAFLSTGKTILSPQKIKLIPYFESEDLFL